MQFRLVLIFLFVASAMAFGQTALGSDELYQQAYDQFLKRDYQAASGSLDQISEADQKKPDILNLRGAIYKRLGELDNAANAFNDALKINPKDWIPKFNLAEINFLRGEYKTARSFLQESLAAMPEVDRIQKQDLVLYKVYLTFLLEGEKDKAKLLLESFDMNSPNPVYYFAQAAWSFKNKEEAKAQKWVESTDGLYSQELRNSYGQALVDIGWMEPTDGVAQTTVTAAPAESAPTEPTSEPTPVATPPVVALRDSGAVPLASSSATPLTTFPEITPAPAMSSATPLDLGISATPAPTPAAAAKKASVVGMILLILLILATAGIAILFLAKRSQVSRADPEFVSFKSSTPKTFTPTPATSFNEFSDEGTGEVHVQEPVETPVEKIAAPIKFQAAVKPSKTPTRKASAPQAAPAKKPVVKTTAKKPAAAKAAPLPPAKPSPAAKTAVAKTPAKATSKPAAKASAPAPAAPVKPVITKTIAAKPAPAPKTPAKPTPAAVQPVRTRVLAAKETAPKPAASKQTRVIPAPVMPPPPAPAPIVQAPVEKPASEPLKLAAKPKATKSKPAPSSISKSVAPLITIPEFEDNLIGSQPPTVLRLVPNEDGSAPSSESPDNTGKS